MENMNVIAYVILAFALIVLFAFGLIKWEEVLIKQGKHPTLQKFIRDAIILAYKTSEELTDLVDERLHSVKKKEIAAYMYNNLLPSEIMLFTYKLKWKELITETQFVDFCSVEFDKIMESFHALREGMITEIEEHL